MTVSPREWASAVDPDRVFLTSREGSLSYGDVAALPPEAPSGQIVVEADGTLPAVVQLMTLPGRGRQMVVLPAGLSTSERRRRVGAASAAAGREALTVLFTSGTTGPAKAVRLTPGNWDAATNASAAHLGHRSDDVWLAAMPLHHVGGLSILYRTVRIGASVHWVPRFDAALVAEQLRGKVTLASLVPTMLRRVLDHDGGRFSGVRAVLVGGGPIPPGLLEEAHERGLPALPTYGMTETCAQVATLRPGSPPRYAVHPLPGVEVRIGAGERIELRGRQISPGNAGEDDRPPDEWFRTPDRGALEDDGALTVAGRMDGVIVSGGENVDPARVEMALMGHPEVRAVAVVGVTDVEWGEAVAAAYEGNVSPGTLAEWARRHLDPHERPKRLLRLDRMPTTGDLQEIKSLFS